jgi:hypothetical protein
MPLEYCATRLRGMDKAYMSKLARPVAFAQEDRDKARDKEQLAGW